MGFRTCFYGPVVIAACFAPLPLAPISPEQTVWHSYAAGCKERSLVPVSQEIWVVPLLHMFKPDKKRAHRLLFFSTSGASAPSPAGSDLSTEMILWFKLCPCQVKHYGKDFLQTHDSTYLTSTTCFFHPFRLAMYSCRIDLLHGFRHRCPCS